MLFEKSVKKCAYKSLKKQKNLYNYALVYAK